MSEKSLCAEIVWNIENFSLCFHNENECVITENFVVNALQKSSWYLTLYPRGANSDFRNYIGVFLNRIQTNDKTKQLKFKFAFAILSKNGPRIELINDITHDFIPGSDWGYKDFISQDKILNEANDYVPGDILSIRCRIWLLNGKEAPQVNQVFLRTKIQVSNCLFDWDIKNYSDFKSVSSKKLHFNPLFESRESLIVYVYYLKHDETKYLKIEVVGDLENKYSLKCNMRILATNEALHLNNLKLDRLPYSVLFKPLKSHDEIIKQADRYLSHDILQLRCNVSIISQELKQSKDVLSLVKSQPLSIWYPTLNKPVNTSMKVETLNSLNQPVCECAFKKDVLSMYRSGNMADFHVQVGVRLFPVHAIILASRSAVFSRMLQNNMKETNERTLKLNELDEETVHQMLEYIYSDDPGELNVESAFKLYCVGHQYEIVGLKETCALCLKQNISVTNVYDILLIADRYRDAELKSYAIRFIGLHEKEIILCDKFKMFAANNHELSLAVFQELAKARLE